MTGHNHLLILELLGNFARARARDLNPGLGEDGTGADNEGNVDDGVDGGKEDGLDGVKRSCRRYWRQRRVEESRQEAAKIEVSEVYAA